MVLELSMKGAGFIRCSLIEVRPPLGILGHDGDSELRWEPLLMNRLTHPSRGQEENVPAEDIKLLTLLSEQLRSELECHAARARSPWDGKTHVDEPESQSGDGLFLRKGPNGCGKHSEVVVQRDSLSTSLFYAPPQ